MTALRAPTAFESFNARSLSPWQVAQTFVPSAHYQRLAKHCHAVMVGPRGSGKTTLLRMLQQPALEAWAHPLAEDYRSRIDFTGVFIAADRSWGAQIEALGGGVLDQATHRTLAIAAFSTHVFRSLTLAMLQRTGRGAPPESRPFRRVVLSPDDETSLVKHVCGAWHLRSAIPSLIALKQALTDRLSSIREIANREAHLGDPSRLDRLADIPFLHLEFGESVAVAVECFDDLIGQSDSKWALMFDELELAPSWIQDVLLRSLRGTDERFYFKLAMSPFVAGARNMETAISPKPDHDFEQIALWYVEKKDCYPFCESLWAALLRSRNLSHRKPRDVLGSSIFETSPKEWSGKGTAYGLGSRLQQLFTELSRRDKTFRDYLIGKRIDPSKLSELSSDQRAADVRKVAPLIAVREFYRAGDDPGKSGRPRERSRKTASLYAGAESLFAISEGNPRWLIAILSRLLDRWSADAKRIDNRTQGDELWRAGERFAAMLRTIPGEPIGASKRGLLSLLNTAGDFFHDQVVTADFKAEPPATFIVDSGTQGGILAMLEQALNAGAIVYVEDGSQVLLTSLRGKRFRISYLLAPYYGLPIRLGKGIALSSVLSGDGNQMSFLEGGRPDG